MLRAIVLSSACLIAFLAAEPEVRFTDILPSSRITFRHRNGASAEKYLVETMGGGCALIDYDHDGWLDIFFVNGGPTPAFRPAAPPRHALYRSNGDGTFTDVTARAGVGGNGAYGMGAAVGDFDRDGLDDLFITSYGPNQLYRNRGDGAFADVTSRAGVGDRRWGTSAAWLDYDNDGWLDLYVCNYVDFGYDKNPFCGDRTAGRRGYCHPDRFQGVPDLLYHNNRDGTFTEVGREVGIVQDDSKGLGVVAGDYNGDGRIDLYVANDSVRNFLFRNEGGRFTEIGLAAGAAFDENGKPQAGMGTDMADYDGDGRQDLFVTNLDTEYNTLYRNLGDDTFQDATVASGLASELGGFTVGFGTRFVDFDNDGWRDLFVANGHVLDNVEEAKPHIRYAQSKLLYRNDGRGGFVDVTARSGAALAAPHVSRSAAFGDLDNDGDLDVVVGGCGAAPQVLRNDGGNARHSIALRFAGARSNRGGVGCAVRGLLGGRAVREQLVGGGSYLSAHDPRLHLGLGQESALRAVEVRWPSGQIDTIDALEAGYVYTIGEGAGIRSREAFRPRGFRAPAPRPAAASGSERR